MHLLVGDEIGAGLVEGKSSLVMVAADLERRFSQEKNLAKINFLMKICQLLDDFFIANDIHAGLFNFTLKTFENLSAISEKDMRTFYVHTLFQILKFAGFMPEVERCTECGDSPESFSLEQGGALCKKHKKDKDVALSPECWDFLKNLKQKFEINTNLSEKDVLKIQTTMDSYAQTSLNNLGIRK